MLFEETRLHGAFVIDIQCLEDSRGFFARSFCADEFARHGLPGIFVQSNISYNRRRGTLRGMHFQLPPHEEGKLVRCTSGAIYDVIIDLRRDSPTYCQWTQVELSRNNGRALYVPPGFAHGFQTLTDETDVSYQMTEFFVPGASAGVRWNDPAFGIDWPFGDPILSDKDANYPDYRP